MPDILEQLKKSPDFYDNQNDVNSACQNIITCDIGTYLLANMQHIYAALQQLNIPSKRVNYKNDDFSLYLNENTLGIVYIAAKSGIAFNNISASTLSIFPKKVYGEMPLSDEKYLIFLPVEIKDNSFVIPPQNLSSFKKVSLGEYLNRLSPPQNKIAFKPHIQEKTATPNITETHKSTDGTPDSDSDSDFDPDSVYIISNQPRPKK